MRVRFDKQLDRFEIKTRKRLIFISCDAWSGVYYLVPTIRLDIHREYGEKCIWLFFLGAFFLIDIFKIKD